MKLKQLIFYRVTGEREWTAYIYGFLIGIGLMLIIVLVWSKLK
jgi:hypothetical protein